MAHENRVDFADPKNRVDYVDFADPSVVFNRLLLVVIRRRSAPGH